MKWLVSTIMAVFLSQALLLADEIVFKKVKVMVNVGEKSEETDAQLVLSDGVLLIKDKKGHFALHEIAYSGLNNVVYEKSEHPRWKTAVFLSPWALFSKGKKHWLTLNWTEKEEGKYVILKLDKKNYQQIIAAMEAKTGKKVERIVE